MNLEEKAKEYSKGFWNDKESAAEDFTAGYNECKTDLIEFLKVNHRATAEQILKHLEEQK